MDKVQLELWEEIEQSVEQMEKTTSDEWETVQEALASLRDALENLRVIGFDASESFRRSSDLAGGSTAPNAAASTDTGQVTGRSESDPAAVAGPDCHDREDPQAVEVRPGIFRPSKGGGVRDRRHPEPVRRVRRPISPPSGDGSSTLPTIDERGVKYE